MFRDVLPHVMIVLGFLLHFATRWDEYSAAHPGLGLGGSLVAFLAERPVRWIAAAISTLVAMLALDEIAPLLGIDPKAAGAALLVGYFASSLTAKLAARASAGGRAP